MLETWSHQVESNGVGGGIVNCGGSVNWDCLWQSCANCPPSPITHMQKCSPYPTMELQETYQPQVHPQDKPGALSAADGIRAVWGKE